VIFNDDDDDNTDLIKGEEEKLEIFVVDVLFVVDDDNFE